ncbi:MULTISPECIES: hypothetical protein [Protofrankia]|uniref:Lipoprotein n=1 Tax=Candidatus Protofrankia datiscae TaxID=2716812 RepID=F8B502_9ACTN|nr:MULTISPECIES: hypothetical protein [Protofrankia]AEH11024.1 hypothetical protein FsymDg_3747 [Candidatus Protofrankia datiscae]
MPRPTSNRLIRAAVAVGAVTALTAALAGCATDVTRPRVEASVGPVFTNLYVQQQALLGHPGLTPAAVKPDCHRSTPGSHDRGAGSDWICQVGWTDEAGRAQNGKFELQVRSNGCYQAGGPTKIVGPIMIQTSTGKNVINPVFEFDGCFDTT